jgi:ATP-dependent protease HslVU (ClpYQ) ATPase subunit
MNIQAQKIELIQMLLNTTEPSIIKKIKAILLENKEEVIGVSEDGTPLTIAKLENDINEAEEDIKAGRVFTTAQVKKHLKIK